MNEKLNYFTAIKFLSKYIKKYKSNFILFYIGWFFETILSIVIPIIFGVMIDEIVYYQNLDTFIKISLIFLMILVFSCVLYFFIYAQHHYLMSMYTFDIKMDAFRRTNNMANSKLITANEKIAKNVTETFQKIQDTVINNYTKIEDNFVAQYLTHEGESVADAKKRLKQEQAERKQQTK